MELQRGAEPARDISAKLIEFLETEFLVDFGQDFQKQTNLFDAQIVDSFGLLELVKYLEREFQITVPNEALTTGRLTSLKAIQELVEELS